MEKIDFLFICEAYMKLITIRNLVHILISFSCHSAIWIRVTLESLKADDLHVHFNIDNINDDFDVDHSHPVIHKDSKGRINIHLGFLQVKHRYRIELHIPAEVLSDLKNKEHKLDLTVDGKDVPNIHCKLLSFKDETSSTSQYSAEIEFFAHKEKLLKEELNLLTNDEKFVKLIFSARVLGRGKGTPML